MLVFRALGIFLSVILSCLLEVVLFSLNALIINSVFIKIIYFF